MYELLFFLISFGVAYFLIPLIIQFAQKNQLVDKPDHRKVHKTLIPALGGVAVFFCFVLTYIYGYKYLTSQYTWLLISATIIVVVGIVDDIKPQKALFKLFIQIVASLLLVLYGGANLSSLYGSLGIFYIHPILQVLLSTFIFVALINSINLIDGVNGLASSLGILYFSFFGIFFQLLEYHFFVLICIGLIGSLLAFLRYNIINPKIFIGDTGSTLIGLIASYFLIYFLKTPPEIGHHLGIYAPYGLAIALFFIPLFDTFRVFFQRILNSRSPFTPDKTHIHHFFLRLGLPHHYITGFLLILNILVFISSFLLQKKLGNTLLITWLIGLFFFGFFILEFLLKKKYFLRTDNRLTLQKFRDFVRDNWYMFYSIIVFALPYERWATSIPIIIFLVFWLISFQRSRLNFNDKTIYYFFIPSLMFWGTVLYYLITNEGPYLASTLELRWLFLLFPTVLFVQKEYFDLKKWYTILSFYLLGIVSFMLISLSLWLVKYLSYKFTNQETNNLVIFISDIPPIYYSLLLNFGLMICFYLRKSFSKILTNQWIQLFIASFIVLSMFAIHSKIGFVAMILIFIFATLIQWRQNKKLPLMSFALIGAIGIFIIFYLDIDKLNWNYLCQSSMEVTKRISIWKTDVALIKNNFIVGYGHNYLNILHYASNLNLNAHNQLFELILEMGIIGFTIFLLTFSFSIFIAIKSNDFFYLGFLFLVLYYSLFESIWTNQTGIVFFSAFNTLLLLKSRLRILSK